jgi:hypothetical protein
MIPGLVGLALARLDLLQTNPIYLVFVASFADSGHIYTTAWRTWLHPTERQRTAAYWLVPLAIAAGFFAWNFSGLPYLWTFVIYATMHHYLKQYYGITRWYETINRHSVKWSGWFSKALMILPIVVYHFRSNVESGLYTDHDFLTMPNAALLNTTLAVYALTVIAWFSLELRNYAQGYREWNRVLSIAFSSLLYAGAFFYGTNVAEVLAPIIIGHGLGYMFLMSLSLQRTRAKYFATFAKGFAVMAATALAFGLFESFAERSIVNFEAPPHAFWASVLLGLYVVPNGCHFVFDAWLWKRSHWESRLVYGFTGRPSGAAGIGAATSADIKTLPTGASKASERAS